MPWPDISKESLTMMNLIIQTHNVELTDWLRQYVEKKIGRLERYLPDIDEIRVELREESTRSASDRAVAQVTVRSRRAILRAEERTGDMFASIDAVADKLERRIRRFKGKRARNHKRAVAEANTLEESLAPVAELVEEEIPEAAIVRHKRFEVYPMDAMEAIEQMELLGHDFFVFLNAETGQINVLYRRRSGDYGLIEPVIA
ncbi:MAG TPA: ribosome-associated translation inhibitor RaiA [Anaerolineae bacterium]|nr:ribosome-associated translation inhibitor RaiA [Anaerolineae bacterium]